jgi:hypothetical protein
MTGMAGFLGRAKQQQAEQPGRLAGAFAEE